MSDLNGLPSPSVDAALPPQQPPQASNEAQASPVIILEGSGAAAHFVWSLEPERLPDDRVLPKSREEQISE